MVKELYLWDKEVCDYLVNSTIFIGSAETVARVYRHALKNSRYMALYSDMPNLKAGKMYGLEFDHVERTFQIMTLEAIAIMERIIREENTKV